MVYRPEHISKLTPYAAGKPIEELAREQQLDRIVKLASNENPLGPSPLALEAVRKSLDNSHRYVNPESYRLVRALSRHYDVPAERLICGAGTDSLLAYIILAFSEAGGELVTSEGTFIGIYVNTRKLGRALRLVPLVDYTIDLDSISKAVSEKTRIIYLANPNNPTGTAFGAEQFQSFMEAVPSRVLVILDEAYYHYARYHELHTDGLSCQYDNLIVTRTFSKDYGLAGLRVGFAAGPPELIRELYKVKLPFEPSAPAQEAAIASLEDSAFLQQTLDLNQRMLKRMSKRFTELGIRQVATTTNFVLLLFPTEQIARAFNDGCLAHGLIVRHVGSFSIPNGIRINTGTEDETGFALHVITQVCEQLESEYGQTTTFKS